MATTKKLPEDLEVLTPTQLAAYLSMGRDKVYELLGAGRIPAVKFGRTYRIPRKPLEEWLERQAAESLSS